MEAALRGGELSPGDQLPAVRPLADHLGVSPSTVAAAYRELRRRGLTTGAGRGGTRIRSQPPISARLRLSAPAGARDLCSGAPDPALLPVLPAVLAPKRLYGGPPITPRLARLGAERLAADGIDPRHLAVVGGALDGVERVLAAWLSTGDRVIVEDPGHAVTLNLVAAMGLEAIPVPVDDLGVRPEELGAALARGADAAILTPRAQAASGGAWDGERAARLRRLLRDHPDVLIIEDDHAGPVAGVPVESVCQSQDRWVTIRSVSKSLGPDLRLALLAGDEATVARVEGRQALGTGWVSYQLQEIVAELWTDSADLLQRAADTYTVRRDALRSALSRQGITMTGRSGLNGWVPVDDEDGIAAAVLGTGWAVASGQRFRIAAPPGIRISFATLGPLDATEFAADLARCMNRRAYRAD